MDNSTFVAAAAHDMKNSVSVIAAYLEDALARMADEPPSAAAQSTAQALYETQRVNGHLVQLLALFKIEEGMYPFEPMEVELGEFTTELLGRARPLAALRGQALRCDMQAGLTHWVFDRDLIDSVVMQALFNAVRYAGRSVQLCLRTHEGRLQIEVADDGPGFPEAMLAVGYPSRQGINARTGSTGLGLYFAHLAAALHGRGAVNGSTQLVNGGALGGGHFIVELP